MTLLVQSGLVLIGTVGATADHLRQKAITKEKQHTYLLSFQLICSIVLQSKVFLATFWLYSGHVITWHRDHVVCLLLL